MVTVNSSKSDEELAELIRKALEEEYEKANK